MSLNNIQLNQQQVAGLYANVLVETHLNPTPPVREEVSLRYLGNNQRNILIIVANDTAPFLPDAELAFLTSVLSACKLSLADVAIINTHSLPSAEGIAERVECKNVLLFGIEPLAIGLPIHFPHFQLQQFNKRTYLAAPLLNQIENDKAVKLQLWNSLKALFCI
jgi:hypothetical protein